MDTDELHATARMARLTVNSEQIDKLRRAVEQMLEYFSHLKDLDVDTLAPTTHAFSGDSGLRDDLDVEAAGESLLENAPEREDRFIVIPNVL